MPLPVLAALIGPASELAKSVLDKIWPPQADPNLKLQAEVALTQAIQQREDTLVTATQNIIVSEMQQGDAYTKRARPTIVYAGLLFIFMVYVGFPIAVVFMGTKFPSLELPAEFWWAWTSVVGIWSVGRSFERNGAQGKLIDSITGTNSGIAGLLNKK